MMERDAPDILVIDGGVPEFGLLQEVRRQSDVRVIMLSGEAREDMLVRAFELGADDYVTKPFSPRVLAARVGACLRRNPMPPDQSGMPLKVGSMILDPLELSAQYGNRRVQLTPREFRVLSLLIQNPDADISVDTLLQQVWREKAHLGINVVRVTMHRLRTKLGPPPPNGPYLEAAPRGYRLVTGEGPNAVPEVAELRRFSVNALPKRGTAIRRVAGQTVS
jgi:DNA-binding response OmpR family regulator